MTDSLYGGSTCTGSHLSHVDHLVSRLLVIATSSGCLGQRSLRVEHFQGSSSRPVASRAVKAIRRHNFTSPVFSTASISVVRSSAADCSVPFLRWLVHNCCYVLQSSAGKKGSKGTRSHLAYISSCDTGGKHSVLDATCGQVVEHSMVGHVQNTCVILHWCRAVQNRLAEE